MKNLIISFLDILLKVMIASGIYAVYQSKKLNQIAKCLLILLGLAILIILFAYTS